MERNGLLHSHQANMNMTSPPPRVRGRPARDGMTAQLSSGRSGVQSLRPVRSGKQGIWERRRYQASQQESARDKWRRNGFHGSRVDSVSVQRGGQVLSYMHC